MPEAGRWRLITIVMDMMFMNDYFQKLMQLHVAVVDMRARQKTYFQFRDKYDLIASKAAEKEVDALLEQLAGYINS